MNQSELIDTIAADSGNEGVSKTNIKWVLDRLAKVSHQALANGEEVPLPGLGKLHVVAKPARTGRNPRTGDSVEIPAKNAPKFSASKQLKDAVNS
jgi:DNA-binding protein HU-beta